MLRKTSPAMTKKLLSSLKSILTDATRRGSIAVNPALGIRMRDDKRHKQKAIIGRGIPTKAEMGKMLSQWPGQVDQRWRPLILVSAFTGLRASELRGLEWDDVLDLESDAPTIRVRQRANAKNTLGDTKTHAAQRTIPLPRLVADALLEWRDICPALDGRLYLVFPNGNGNVENHSNIANRGWKELQRQCGVTRIAQDDKGKPVVKAKYGVHALRHFFASICIDGGMNAKKLQSLLGHSSIAMTLDVYSHLFPSEADDRAKLSGVADAIMSAVSAPA